jgi:hypothetical protein
MSKKEKKTNMRRLLLCGLISMNDWNKRKEFLCFYYNQTAWQQTSMFMYLYCFSFLSSSSSSLHLLTFPRTDIIRITPIDAIVA